jgi:hypothetical protein
MKNENTFIDIISFLKKNLSMYYLYSITNGNTNGNRVYI